MIYCHFCHGRVADVVAAVDAGWIASFYYAGEADATPDPVCPKCQESRLELDQETGELICEEEES